MRDAGDVEDGIEIFQRIEAGVITERSFGAELIEVNVAFQNYLGTGWHFEVYGLAFHQLNRFLAKESGDQVLLYVRRRGNDGGKRDSRLSADRDSHLHLSGGTTVGKNRSARRPRHEIDRSGSTGGSLHNICRALPGRTGEGARPHTACAGGAAQSFAIVFRTNLLPLPVQAGGVLIENLETIHSDVPLAALGIAGDNAWKSDEAACVLGPALQDGEIE